MVTAAAFAYPDNSKLLENSQNSTVRDFAGELARETDDAAYFSKTFAAVVEPDNPLAHADLCNGAAQIDTGSGGATTFQPTEEIRRCLAPFPLSSGFHPPVKEQNMGDPEYIIRALSR